MIHALENAARILPAYLRNGLEAQLKMIEHAAILKEILVQAISGNHRHIPLDILDVMIHSETGRQRAES